MEAFGFFPEIGTGLLWKCQDQEHTCDYFHGAGNHSSHAFSHPGQLDVKRVSAGSPSLYRSESRADAKGPMCGSPLWPKSGGRGHRGFLATKM